MKAMGFRVEKEAVHWAVISNDDENVVEANGVIKVPKSYDDDGQALSYIRTKVIEAIGRNSPDCAGVRYPETKIRKGHFAAMDARCRVEGVVVEAIASTDTPVAVGGMVAIAGSLGTKSAKHYTKPESKEVRGFKYQKQDSKHKDAVIAAVAALEEHSGSTVSS